MGKKRIGKGPKKCGHVDRRKIGKRQKEDGKGQRRFGNVPKKVLFIKTGNPRAISHSLLPSFLPLFSPSFHLSF